MKILKISLKVISVLLLLSVSHCVGVPDDDELNFLLERADLEYCFEQGIRFTPVINNNQCSYDFALKADNGMELRYLIFPVDSLKAEYEKYLERKKGGFKKYYDPKLKDTVVKESMTNPTTFEFFESHFLSVVVNISEKQDSSVEKIIKKIKYFPDSDVRNEFFGDKGCYVFTKLDPEFGQNFKYSLTYMIYKKDKGCFINFRLFKDQQHFDDLYKSREGHRNFYNLHFFQPKPPYTSLPKGSNRVYWCR